MARELIDKYSLMIYLFCINKDENVPCGQTVTKYFPDKQYDNNLITYASIHHNPAAKQTSGCRCKFDVTIASFPAARRHVTVCMYTSVSLYVSVLKSLIKVAILWRLLDTEGVQPRR